MAEVTEEKHEHKASSIAKAGLTTGIIGTSLGALNMVASGAGILGGIGGNGNQKTAALMEKIDNLRDENLLLKANANTDSKINDLQIQVVRLQDQNASMRAEFGQALNFEASMRTNGDTSLRQYVDDNFVHAKKCVDAQAITPPVMSFPYGNPSSTQLAPVPFPAPFPAPFYPPFPPVVPGVNQGTTGGTTTTQTTANNNG